MTATAVLESATDVSLAANAELLIRAMQNVALFACKDDTLPALCALHFTGAGGELRIEATDRYTLAQEWLPCEAGTLDILVDAKQAVAVAKALTAALKPSKYLAETPSVTITVEGHYARFALAGHVGPTVSAVAETIGSQYPDKAAAKFFPEDEAEYVKAYDGHITVNAEYLARIAKVDIGDKKHTFPRLIIGGARQPVIVHVGDAFRAVLVPLKPAE